MPRKNIRQCGGIPLVGRAVCTAIACRRALGGNCRVIVSTDSEKIAVVAREYGAEVPFVRPAELSGDSATSRDVVLHAVDWLEALGTVPDEVVLLQATSPLTTQADVMGCIALFRKLGNVVVTNPPGTAYISTPQWLRDHDHWLTATTVHKFAVPPERAIDVDYEDDLQRCNEILKHGVSNVR